MTGQDNDTAREVRRAAKCHVAAMETLNDSIKGVCATMGTLSGILDREAPPDKPYSDLSLKAVVAIDALSAAYDQAVSVYDEICKQG